MAAHVFTAFPSRARSRRSLLAPAWLLGLATLPGCATMAMLSEEKFMHEQRVTVRTNPAGAHVTVDGEPAGTTPTTIAVHRRRPHRVRVELAGHPPRDFRLKNALNPELLLNVLLMGGAPFGLVIDVMTGAWDDHLEPAKIRVAFDPDAPATGAAARPGTSP